VLGDIVKVERNGNTQYWLKIIGKGNKYREVPVPSSLIQIIDESYTKLTGESWRTVPKTLPLIPRIRGQSVSALKPLGNPQDTESILRGNCRLVIPHGRGSIGKTGKGQHPLAQAYAWHPCG
jgi:hypothetical protein